MQKLLQPSQPKQPRAFSAHLSRFLTLQRGFWMVMSGYGTIFGKKLKKITRFETSI